MTYPRYVPHSTGSGKWNNNDINAVVDHVLAGETTSGFLAFPHNYIIRELAGTAVYDAVDASGDRVFGGPDDAGSVDGSDPSAVIQAAIDDVAGHGSILLMNSGYHLTNTLTISPSDSGLTLLGENRYTTLYSPEADYAITIEGTSGSRVSNVQIGNFHIEGYQGIKCTYFDTVDVSNISYYQLTDQALRVTGGWQFTGSNNLALSCGSPTVYPIWIGSEGNIQANARLFNLAVDGVTSDHPLGLMVYRSVARLTSSSLENSGSPLPQGTIGIKLQGDDTLDGRLEMNGGGIGGMAYAIRFENEYTAALLNNPDFNPAVTKMFAFVGAGHISGTLHITDAGQVSWQGTPGTTSRLLITPRPPYYGITPSGSPYTYQNTAIYPMNVYVGGGTVSAIAFSLDNSSWITVPFTSGIIPLEPGDYVKVTYSSAPTMYRVPYT